MERAVLDDRAETEAVLEDWRDGNRFSLANKIC